MSRIKKKKNFITIFNASLSHLRPKKLPNKEPVQEAFPSNFYLSVTDEQIGKTMKEIDLKELLSSRTD